MDYTCHNLLISNLLGRKTTSSKQSVRRRRRGQEVTVRRASSAALPRVYSIQQTSLTYQVTQRQPVSRILPSPATSTAIHVT
ncbi:hypothetical protein J6590_050849, partial [Homalodisca vitripennis]